MERPRLSVVVVSFERCQRLRECLHSVRAAVTRFSHELLVVDNGSRDGSALMVREEFPRASLIENKANRGYSVAVNQALLEALGDYFLCLNNDIRLFPESVDRMVAYLETQGEVGIIGGKLLNPDETLYPSARTFPSFSTALFHRSSLATQLFPRRS